MWLSVHIFQKFKVQFFRSIRFSFQQHLFRKILQQKLLNYQNENIFQATLSHDSQRNFIKFLLQTETL